MTSTQLTAEEIAERNSRVVDEKGNLLFSLHQARDRLARGAIPVITEGPFDAIAVTLADRDRYAGLAPCGTALTSAQIEALSRIADLRQAGILVAFDGDTAGRKAAVRAYDLLRATSDRLRAAALPGKDPAEILESYGAAALCTALRDRVEPLSAFVIDAHLEPWERRLRDTGGPLLAMRSVAAVIADLLPTETAEAIRRITRNQELTTIDEDMQPIANPLLPQIASKLPADAAFQITRTAERLGFTDYSDVLAEVANAIIRKTFKAKGNPCNSTPALVEANFPRPPPAARANAAPTTTRPSRSNSHPKPSRSRRLHPRDPRERFFGDFRLHSVVRFWTLILGDSLRTPNILLVFAEVSSLEGSADPSVRGGWDAVSQAGGAVDAGPVHATASSSMISAA